MNGLFLTESKFYKPTDIPSRYKIDVTSKYAKHFDEIEKEMKMKFILRPTIFIININNHNYTPGFFFRGNDDTGEIYRAEIHIPKEALKDESILIVILRHEIREMLYKQNYYDENDDGHYYAQSKEAIDIVKYKVDVEKYDRLQTRVWNTGKFKIT